MQNLHATSKPSAPVNAALQSGHELQPRAAGIKHTKSRNFIMILPLFWLKFLRLFT